MALFRLKRPLYSTYGFSGVIVLCLLFVALFSACGSSNTSSSTTSTSVSATKAPAQQAVSPATATAQAVTQMIAFIGQPTAKIVSGTTFEVDGVLKNGDSKQHDIYVKVSLLDSAGNVIATTIQNVDNVAGGATIHYAIKGTTPQPTWAKVVVTVEKVTENIGGSGDD
jgi:hypothetical protein